jgi:hypothetical protein
MFDGFKILNLCTGASITQNSILQDFWTSNVKIEGGEVLKEWAVYFGIAFNVKYDIPRLTGSLHKYFNNGEHNANDFTFTDLLAVIDDLKTKFNIDPETSLLNNVEFGVNVIVPFEVNSLLDCLISYQNQPFNREVERGKVYYQCKKTEHIVKIYNKGLQYKRAENILRFEIKIIRMRYLQSKGIDIDTLQSLTEPDNYPKIGRLLLSVFDDILFDDKSIEPQTLEPSERELYFNGRNPKYWIKDSAMSAAQRKQKERERTRFNELLDNHRNGDNMPLIARELIKSKWGELSRNPQLTELPEKMANVTKPDFRYRMIIRQYENEIQQQRRGSKFISAKTLKEKPKLLKQLSGEHRKNQRKHNLEESYYVAHNLRNAETNPRNNLRRRIQSSREKLANSLFNESILDSTLKLTSTQKEILKVWKGTGFDILSQ